MKLLIGGDNMEKMFKIHSDFKPSGDHPPPIEKSSAIRRDWYW